MSQTNERKIEHIRAFDQDSGIERGGRGFANIHLTHRALPEIDFASIDTRCEFLGKNLKIPLLISSMTGGNHPLIKTINKNLAVAAEAKNIALAVGSQRVMFSDHDASDSFALRKYAPNTVLIANIGAVQLNYGFDAAKCQQAIDILDADALYLHLNPLQEAIQPEGNTNFANLASKIELIGTQLPVPIILKEVGAGLAVADIELGIQAGVHHFDVAGTGGTSWSRIEYQRRRQEDDDLGLLFQDWGISTVDCLQEIGQYLAQQTTLPSVKLIASGGIRSGIDMAKSVILGAHLCGVAAPFLKPAMQSADAVIDAINKLENEFKTAMFLLGKRSVSALRGDVSLIRLQR